ncbi:MAG TPA: DNA ligase D [Puia sp.]|nr:DNA ligase D [Puia sp.]
MPLKEYRKKRSFVRTPEPQGGKPSGKTLQFVVQKHAASRLHYDFRLEMEGVLKSWAVPKGPSMNPADKRLAMQVEDHPFGYKDFEGIIPPGNYGAGTVMVWDTGTYEPLEKTKGTKADQDRTLRKELKAGSLKFRLNGKKLKGEFALVKTHGRGENSWLLIKHRDRYAMEDAITEKDRSVISRKTLEGIAADPKSKEWKSNRAQAQGEKGVEENISLREKAQTRKKRATATDLAAPAALTAGAGLKAPMPKDLVPMLATLVDHPPADEDWQYEIKWDGYRALAYLNKGKVEIRSRNNKSFDEKFYPVHKALQEWKINAVLDGEVVVIDEKGQSNFGSLQNWRSEADGELIYYLFDVLWLEGKDLTGLSLTERRDLLRSLVPEEGILRLSDTFDVSGKEFFAAAKKMGLEGIIAKKADSLYTPGVRTREWLKIKTANRQEVVIGGYTRNEGTSKLFSSLLVGVFEKGKLQYTGKIGTGFNDKMQKEMMRQFKPLEQKTSPFTAAPDVNKPSRFRPNPPTAKAVWLKPELLCEVSFREMTEDGVMRHPSFEGMREDKSAKEVGREKALPVENVMAGEPGAKERAKTPKKKAPVRGVAKPAREITGPVRSGAKREKKAGRPLRETAQLDTSRMLVPAKTGERKSLLNPTDESQVRSIQGHELHFTNLSKIYWPKEKLTKRDLLNYYYQVAPYMLPYLKDRPQSLNRYPNGIEGKSFYQKDVSGMAPDWVETFPYRTADEDRDKEFLVCTNEAGLLYMASLGCIEINPWSSRVKAPDNPDWCVIDLDPDKKTPFDKVIEAALVTRDVLQAAGIPSCCKTSGSTGLHIYFPLGGKYTYEHSKEFARVVVTIVQSEIPSFTSIQRTVSERKGKMYLDFLQNRPQATLAAPYSARPKPGATVSAPLHWEEVKKGLKMQDFTILNMQARLKSMGDIFKPVLGKGIQMEKALKTLEGLKKND